MPDLSTPTSAAATTPAARARFGRVGVVLAGSACVLACAAPGLLAGTAGLAAMLGGEAGLLATAVTAAGAGAALLLVRRRSGPSATPASCVGGCSCSR